MHRKTVLAAAVFASALTALPALAADDVCLRLNDVRGTEVVDNQTLLLTDRQDNEYTVRMTGACVGLHTAGQNLTFRPLSELSCLRQGDTVGYSLPGEPLPTQVHGQTQQSTCFIGSISAGAQA